jgi:hypothetical protein
MDSSPVPVVILTILTSSTEVLVNECYSKSNNDLLLTAVEFVALVRKG